jgi:hypothetical protein
METLKSELIKGNCYSKEEIESFGCKYIKETTITKYYRKEDILYIFDTKCIDSSDKYKLLTIHTD